MSYRLKIYIALIILVVLVAVLNFAILNTNFVDNLFDLPSPLSEILPKYIYWIVSMFGSLISNAAFAFVWLSKSHEKSNFNQTVLPIVVFVFLITVTVFVLVFIK